MAPTSSNTSSICSCPTSPRNTENMKNTTGEALRGSTRLSHRIMSSATCNNKLTHEQIFKQILTNTLVNLKFEIKILQRKLKHVKKWSYKKYTLLENSENTALRKNDT
jgi:hypothetical protein